MYKKTIKLGPKASSTTVPAHLSSTQQLQPPSTTSTNMSGTENMDTTTPAKRAGTEPTDAPPTKTVALSKLAAAYNKKVKATKAARNKGNAPDEDQNVETIPINEAVNEPTNVAGALPYNQAPLMNLRNLMPQGYQNEQSTKGTTASTSKLDASFRADKIEFVLMYRPKNPARPDDNDWEVPEKNNLRRGNGIRLSQVHGGGHLPDGRHCLGQRPQGDRDRYDLYVWKGHEPGCPAESCIQVHSHP